MFFSPIAYFTYVFVRCINQSRTLLFLAVIDDEAFVTSAETDGEAIGALVLGRSLQAVSATRNLVCLTSDHISLDIR